jgi:hypothetical protein
MTLPCGCCQTRAEADATHRNRPWLSAIDYRLGTFGSFRRDILDDIAGTRELGGLRSRVSDDYSVAAVEMWAAVADVLTFYTERIANEAFIRTATLRDSVLRLVRVIDYQLAPGAAATTTLAFTLERDAIARIPARTRVQSVPAEGETPQKYETTEALLASAHLNRLRLVPEPVPDDPLAPGDMTAIAAPDAPAIATAGALTPGSLVALYTPTALEVLTVADVTPVDDRLVVRWREPIVGAGFGPAANGVTPGFGVQRLGRTFHVFGYDAPATVVVSDRKNPNDATTTFLAQARTSYALPATNALELDTRVPDLKVGAALLVVSTAGPVTPVRVTSVSEQQVIRRASYTVSGVTKTIDAITGKVTVVGITPGLPAGDLRALVIHELVGEPLRFWPYRYPDVLATGTVYLAGRRAGWSAIELERTIEKGAYKPGIPLDVRELGIDRRVIALDGQGGAPISTTVAGAALVGLDATFSATPGDPATLSGLGLDGLVASPMTVLVSAVLSSPLTLASATPELTLTIGAGPPQTIGLDPALLAGGVLSSVANALQTAIRSALPGSPSFSQAMVWTAGQALVVAAGVPGDAVTFGPSEDDATTVVTLGLDPPQTRFLDGLLSGRASSLAGTSVNGTVRVQLGVDPVLDRGVTLAIPASVAAPAPIGPAAVSAFASALGSALGVSARPREDTRILLLPPIRSPEPRSWVRLALALDKPLALDAASAVLLGNVAAASHGESVRSEIVGDGNSALPFQRFTLRKTPVTFVPAAVAGGVSSSLQLFVNDALWTEVPTLFGTKPTDEVYATRLADDGARTIQFGDGLTGKRATTGRDNIVATYRKGLGLAGRVRPGTLTTLLDRPTGLKSATNPVAAEGGADPETLARARQTAPGTVRTFGRAISLRDFEDATLVAGEVAKSTAAWVWTGRRRVVHVTVAGQGGVTFSAAKLASLMATLSAARDPNHPLLIGNYVRVAILVAATVIVDDRAVAETVLANARTALLDAMSFDRRSFAEAVDLSDVYGVLQGVKGVKAVDIDRLDLKSTDPDFRIRHGLDPLRGQLQPRLYVLPARPGGTPSTVLPAEIAWVEVPALDVVLRSTGGITL